MSKQFGYFIIFSMTKMMFCPDGFQLMGSWFCLDSVSICLLLLENMIICDKYLSKCGKRAKLNDLRFYYIVFLLHFALYRLKAKCNKN